VRARAKPDGAVLLVRLEPREELREPRLELALERPRVDVDPEALQRALDPAQHLRNCVVRCGRELRDVRAAVAVCGRLLAAPGGLDGLAEALHLGARVVVVVLAFDRVAGEREQPRDAVAVDAVAGSGDDDRTSRIGGDELHLDALGRSGRAAAVLLAGGEYLPERFTIDRRCDPEVDESPSRNLSPLDPGDKQHLRKLSLGKRPS
jgi:hypothetical protein